MKLIHFIAIAVALLLAFAIFKYSNTVPAPPKDTAGQAAGMAANMPKAASFDSLLKITKLKLSPKALKLINAQESLINSADNTIKINALDSLGSLWRLNKYLGFAATYYKQAGKLENSEKKLNFAAHLYEEEMATEKLPDVKQWLANGAIECYNQSIAINPKSDSARFNLANLLINVAGQPMVGVQQLLKIVEDDPSTIPANLVLGSMAIESGQYDKAISRGELILKYHKDNWQARLFMAEAYKQKGDKQKAIQMLDEAKQYNSDPQFVKDIEAYKKTL